MSQFQTAEDVRQVLMADGRWHEVRPGSWRNYPSHKQFRFETLEGTEVRGRRDAVLATLLAEPASA